MFFSVYTTFFISEFFVFFIFTITVVMLGGHTVQPRCYLKFNIRRSRNPVVDNNALFVHKSYKRVKEKCYTHVQLRSAEGLSATPSPGWEKEVSVSVSVSKPM